MTAAREHLDAVRRRLLELHKRVLESKRADLERFQGRLSGAEFLQVATDSMKLSWLAPLSELIVAIDETIDDEREADDRTIEGLIGRARALVAPPDPDTPFGRRYLSLLQLRPEVAVAHGALIETLGR